MMKKIVIVELCDECPYFNEWSSISPMGFCEKQDKAVDGFKMDENCPLLTIHQDFIDIAKKRAGIS